MPYLRPDRVLSKFSRFVSDDVREALPSEERFLRGQLGSMASTMEFLGGELTGKAHALGEQEAALEAALDETAAELETIGSELESAGETDPDGHRESVEMALSKARDRISDAPVPQSPETTIEKEAVLTNACENVLASIDDLPDEHARRLRKPLFGFLDTRVDGQLRLLGREDESGDE